MVWTSGEIYRSARGSRVLGTQADREYYALVVHSGHDSPVGRSLCRCNCGATVPSGDFLPGHEQTALQDRVRQIGTVTGHCRPLRDL